MRLLLDSSVLIDVLRGRRGRPAWLRQLVLDGHSLETSALNVAEVRAGMRPGEEVRTQGLLGALRCHPVTVKAGEKAGDFRNHWARRGRTLSLADAVVAAVTVEQGCTLVTDNRRDFPMPEVRLFDLPA